MAPRHSHHRKHAIKKAQEDTPSKPPPPPANPKPAAPAATPYVAPVAGPWSAWTLDSEDRGFYFRNRVTATGQMQWEYATSTPLQTYAYPQLTAEPPSFYYRPVVNPPMQPAYDYTPRYPVNVAANDVQSSDASMSDATSDSEDFDVAAAKLAGFSIPAIIDVDSKKIEMRLPNLRSGDTTFVWDRKHGHSSKTKIYSDTDSRVEEWLRNEFSV
ncbi:hypothetical protein CGMCC3_g4899 [Colletotrichum fructicola]|uniref:Uncharacterized protein n=1 Tax=Colletotrichum fructicola (strain Nara gc5) TaxID=1213859 RepID=L2G5S8_COLFN|nr:uncharacterized protein CGMCC3_g4899 [Colletotrichum fructicola]KAF4488735.1 hypothetical protein CGGC5_v003046 [Colletotrichum fructicola Nara gc5]KAE9579085.1 hypothetical protein CGMCC3_g4899 [Colletotrichum fructicola]KAF4885183.1 hypothetical protein CGCFRS4_v012146 [Colletotrichum fructicola]KAF4939469.1 hypothetical protein CGCF245_v003611 [Colletotrichum fructicola]KAF5503366.1 hypothetical protein CGCF413_v005700 [Colletotrichum fructicola]